MTVTKRKKGVVRTPLQIVEALADERYGHGSAISVDRKGGGYVVTAWCPRGLERASSGVCPTKGKALSAARRAIS